MAKSLIVKKDFPRDTPGVLNCVKETICKVLKVDLSNKQDIKSTDRIFNDLGISEFDYMKIVRKLESIFHIKVPPDELKLDFIYSDPKFVQKWKVSPEGIAEIKRRMPFIDLKVFEKSPNLNRLVDLCTVGSITAGIKYYVNKKPRRVV
jgi:acyl carrier protein